MQWKLKKKLIKKKIKKKKKIFQKKVKKKRSLTELNAMSEQKYNTIALEYDFYNHFYSFTDKKRGRGENW